MKGLKKRYAIGFLLVCASITLVFSWDDDEPTKVAEPLIRNNGGSGGIPH